MADTLFSGSDKSEIKDWLSSELYIFEYANSLSFSGVIKKYAVLLSSETVQIIKFMLDTVPCFSALVTVILYEFSSVVFKSASFFNSSNDFELSVP